MPRFFPAILIFGLSVIKLSSRDGCEKVAMGGASLHDQLISRKKHGAALISDFLSAKLR